MPNIDLSILNQRQTPAFYASSLATRPAFGFAGRIFIDTDSPSTGLYRDTGAAWVQIADPGAGTTGTLQQVTTNGNTTTQGITITAGGLSSNIVTIAENALSTSTNYIAQTMPGLDFWRIYGTAAVSDQSEMVFLVGDNGSSYASGIGQRFRYSYDATASGTAKDVLIVDYDLSYFNTSLGINTPTPTADFDVHSAVSVIAQLNQTVATNNSLLAFQNNNVGLWRIGNFYNAGANDWGIFDVVGAIQPVTVKKTTGQVLIGTSTVGSGKLVVASATGDNGVQIVGASAPSLRIDNAESGPTKRAGFGISTATNNFIQGSADRDFCMFNGSTTASPILFGIYDTTNVQEAARITATRNFNVGSNIDSGFKLYVKAGASGLLLSAGTTSSDNALLIQNSAETTTLLNIKGNGAATFSSTIRTGNAVIPGFAGANDIALPNNMALRGANAANATGFSLIKLNTSDQVAINSDGATSVTISGNTLLGTGTDNGTRLQNNGNFCTGNEIYGFSTSSFVRISGGGSNVGGASVLMFGEASSSTPGRIAVSAVGTQPIEFYAGGALRFSMKSNGTLNSNNMPTSAAGLVSGDIYSNLGVLTIVP